MSAALRHVELAARLDDALGRFGSDLVLATSLSAEDLVVHHALDGAAARAGQQPRAFFLDTGRLHEATYRLLDAVQAKLATPIDVYFPDPVGVETLVRAQGLYGFRVSVEQRKACCAARKLQPLGRALAGKRAWLTGLRREQSPTRSALGLEEPDAPRAGVTKLNPIFDWEWPEVLAYLDLHQVPRSALYALGYLSIGCEPCTRAVAEGEDLRAGRWWWESPDHKECGLHQGGAR